MKTKTRYWKLGLEDGTTLSLASKTSKAPRFAVECRYESQPLRKCGHLNGLGTMWETDKDAAPLPMVEWALYERRVDAKAAADNSLPHAAANEDSNAAYLFAFTKLDQRKVVKVAKAEEITREEWSRLRKSLLYRGPRVTRNTSHNCGGVATKARVEEAIVRDAELRELGLDASERRHRMRWL